jgi:hypothetical protein
MAAARHFESTSKFKSLRFRTKLADRIDERQVVFAGTRSESFSLRETRRNILLFKKAVSNRF